MDSLAIRVQDIEGDFQRPNGIKNIIKSLQNEIAALKAQKAILSVNRDSATYLESKLDCIDSAQDIHEFCLEVLVGVVDHQQRQIDSLKLANASKIASSLIDNVIIGGVRQVDNENCRDAAAHFFINRMYLNPCQEDLLYAERLGEGITKGSVSFPHF